MAVLGVLAAPGTRAAQSIAMIRQAFTIHGGARTRTRARRFH